VAEKQEMEITIGRDGKVEIHVQGVDGKSCMDLTKELEEALGVVTSREKTGEYFKEDSGQTVRILTGEGE